MSSSVSRAGIGRAAQDASEVASALLRAGIDEVDISPRRRAEYSSDASLYRVVPQAVAFPRDADDVAGIVGVCRNIGVPVTARGAGTSTAGNAVGVGVVVDTRRHMNRIRAIDGGSRLATVEPGVVLDDLQRAARPHGLRFGPEPATHDRCTIGGMIGNNSCGSRALGFGRTSDSVDALTMITGTGDRLIAGSAPHATALPGAIGDALAELTGRAGSTIATELGRFSRQISGYGLQYLLDEHDHHLGRALVGSEGTCGVLTEATLRLVDVPPVTVLVLLGYVDMAAAADAAPALAVGFGAIAVEGLDRRIVDVVARRRPIPDFPRGSGWLLVELAGDDVDELAARVPDVVAAGQPLDHRVLLDPAEAAAVWSIREAGAGLVARDAERPVHAGWEDAAVPPQHLGDYLRSFESLMADHGLDGVPYGHFGDGCVHVRIDFPFDGGRTTVFREFLTDAARLVVGFGGSLSGEHGDGRARSELLPTMYSPTIIEAFGRFKAAFDPDGIMNPGVLVDPAPVDRDLRPARRRTIEVSSAFTLPDDHGDIAAAVHRCTGVGKCVVGRIDDGVVMCPSYAATHDEHHSTRARARVLQEAATGGVPDGLRSPVVRDSLDWCMACKGCLAECPTGVDMATYKAEVLHHTYRRRLRPRVHYSLGWLPRWLRLAALAPRLSSALVRVGPFQAAVKALAGIDRRRTAPTVHRPPSVRTAAADRATGHGPTALLWVDTFTGHLRPEVVAAAARVLGEAGYDVRTTSARRCCGLTWMTTGQLDGARRRVRRTIEGLDAELDGSSRSDTVIVGLEPSCTAMLRHESRELLGRHDRRARRVAGAVRTLAEALAERDDWEPPRLDGLRVVAQPHCHHHAILGWDADRALLTHCGVDLHAVGGCCGLAGDFGTARGRFEISERIAETALLPALRRAPQVLALADGYSCSTQIRDLDGREPLHLAQLLDPLRRS